MCLSHDFPQDNHKQRNYPPFIMRESPVCKQDDVLRCCPPDTVCCPPFSPLFPLCVPQTEKSGLLVQTGSSVQPRTLVHAERAERANQGWDIPVSRCPWPIGLFVCHTGLISPTPPSGYSATRVGYSAS